jgi:DNA-binding transcriptional regulator LsrR (DeoR family)
VARIDELRLMTRAARMYYQQDMRQSDIADRLHLSQATVSRLLKRAEQEGIVRITVSVPMGVYADLEEALISQYGLQNAVVADCVNHDDEGEILRNIGAAAAYYLESTVEQGECIGISSWSATLLAMVDAMHPLPRPSGVQVVQILGGVGNPAAEVHANQLISRLAAMLHGEAKFLPAPGVVGSADAAQVLLSDQFVCETMALFDRVSMALVGIGALEPSKLLASSGNVFSSEELEMLRSRGAVGDICVRFFDAQGKPVLMPLDDRVISMRLEQFKRVKRSVGVAGGKRKHEAIRSALLGGLINVLITDRFTAEELTGLKGDVG